MQNSFHAKLDCFVDLAAAHKGVHMSRFEEVVLGGAAFRAEVSIEARFPEHKPAPVSGVSTQEIYTMFGAAVRMKWPT
ncbi:MAG: GTP cyclohydrolase, FolE2/MptA family [Solirubrobacterales bacterium]